MNKTRTYSMIPNWQKMMKNTIQSVLLPTYGIYFVPLCIKRLKNIERWG